MRPVSARPPADQADEPCCEAMPAAPAPDPDPLPRTRVSLPIFRHDPAGVLDTVLARREAVTLLHVSPHEPAFMYSSCGPVYHEPVAVLLPVAEFRELVRFRDRVLALAAPQFASRPG